MDITGISAAATAVEKATDKQLFGAQVVTKTLDYMNSDQSGSSTNADYDFQKSVLSAHYMGKGTLANTKT
ncbi:hypothetical protein [Maridesulfovibrio hydrothermalis]|uniref:Uncharacterized protein n=1 Tax=Maridesulfovibrio hydrothermalis AM13 = DSM 14728 TaxID=1121451 RepID=L0R606_9BACT|nr:hypothetical protein [Maridesulfovibrio hydrothermalis]CCO22109.1 conserved protein of unknown function [Maridesulfovibrio hydrothermalis AM13 = DSM 14728]